MRIAFFLRALLFAVLAAGLPGHALAEIVYGEAAKAEKAAPEPKLRIASKVTGPRLKLAPVTDADAERVRAANERGPSKSPDHAFSPQRVFIGVERPLETQEAAGQLARGLDWTAVEGGQAARLSATSPDAPAMRVALNLAGVSTDLEMVFFGSASPDKLFGPYRVGDIADRATPWWSPLTEGETLTVEFFAPARAAGVDPRIANVAHLFSNPAARLIDKRLQDIGKAGSCNVDIPCSPLRTSTAFQNAVSSVAQMVFNDGSFTGLCTGTLLNDTDSSTQKPYLFSANHCFDAEDFQRSATQLQAVASTLTTLWFFEATTCGSSTVNPNWQQVGGGATYLYSNVQSDALFIRLNNQPPAGAFYSGYDTSQIGVGSGTTGIHHPQGDLKKVSQGSVIGFNRWDSSTASNQYIEIRWSSGTTEGGSSGSSFFTLANGQYVVRGGLRGGSALCSNPNGTDLFSRFDQIYPNISQYLAAQTMITPITNVTGLWWVPSEAGWGLNLVYHSGSNVVFATWFTFGQDGKRTWLGFPAGHWTSPTSFTGTLYQTSGPSFTGAFDASQVNTVAIGSATFTLSDADNATWSWTANGFSGTKSVRRFSF
jgi:lysyl endopeptidase